MPQQWHSAVQSVWFWRVLAKVEAIPDGSLGQAVATSDRRMGARRESAAVYWHPRRRNETRKDPRRQAVHLSVSAKRMEMEARAMRGGDQVTRIASATEVCLLVLSVDAEDGSFGACENAPRSVRAGGRDGAKRERLRKVEERKRTWQTLELGSITRRGRSTASVANLHRRSGSDLRYMCGLVIPTCGRKRRPGHERRNQPGRRGTDSLPPRSDSRQCIHRRLQIAA
jgi:hypothetical protein